MRVLEHDKVVMVAEDLNLFEVPVPASLAGLAIVDSDIRATTGCSVVAIRLRGVMNVVTDPSVVLEVSCDMVLIGTQQAEAKFLGRYAR